MEIAFGISELLTEEIYQKKGYTKEENDADPAVNAALLKSYERRE